jgi:hypothetical protein
MIDPDINGQKAPMPPASSAGALLGTRFQGEAGAAKAAHKPACPVVNIDVFQSRDKGIKISPEQIHPHTGSARKAKKTNWGLVILK